MKPGICKSLLVGAALAAAGAPAHAAIISGSLSFTATGFPAGGTVDPIVGVVSFSFDNSANFFNAANGSTQNGAPVSVSFSGLNLPGSWTPVLTYVASGFVGGNPVTDLLAIGHALNGTVTNGNTDDWRIALNSISTTATFREFTYTLANSSTQFQTFRGTVTPVPEPGTAALAALGLTGILVARRRRARR